MVATLPVRGWGPRGPGIRAAVTSRAFSPAPGVLVLEPPSELDLPTAADLRRRFDEVVDAVANPTVVVPLGAVRFLGSAGVAVLLDIRAAAIARGGRLALVAPSPPAARVIGLLGLGRELRVYRTIDDAVAA